VVHYLWLVKADIREPAKYAAILAVLLGYRIAVWANPKAAADKTKALHEPRVEVPER
jgi:sulfoxide reductase heme-binding subunit YedZ